MFHSCKHVRIFTSLYQLLSHPGRATGLTTCFLHHRILSSPYSSSSNWEASRPGFQSGQCHLLWDKTPRPFWACFPSYKTERTYWLCLCVEHGLACMCKVFRLGESLPRRNLVWKSGSLGLLGEDPIPEYTVQKFKTVCFQLGENSSRGLGEKNKPKDSGRSRGHDPGPWNQWGLFLGERQNDPLQSHCSDLIER